MNRLNKMVAGVVLLLALAAAAPASAQQGAVSGTVMDPLGARVPNAIVTLTTNGPSRETKSGGDGAFTFANVPPGLYQVVVSLQEFQPFTSEPFYVGAGGTPSVRATLQVSPLEQAVVVTATATEISQAQTGAPVTVLDSATLDALNKVDVLEALRLVPGAQVVQTGARGGQTSLFIRGGNGAFNKVLIDGSVANSIGGDFDFAQLSTSGIDRVEVLRQTNSVMYGSDALAGVVQITTKRGRTRVPEFTYAADAGNLGTWTSDAGIGGVIKRFNYYSSYRQFETDNDVPNNSYSNGTYAGRFGVAAGTSTDISGTIRRTDTEFGSTNAITLYGVADDSVSKNAATYISLATNSQVTNRWQVSARFGLTDQTLHYLNPTPTGTPFDNGFGFGVNYLGNLVTVTDAEGQSVTGRAILDYAGSYPSTFDSRSARRALSGETTFTVNDALSISGGGRYEREQAYNDPDAEPSATRNNGGVFVEGRGSVMNRHFIAAGIGLEHNEAFGEAVTPRLSIASYVRQPSAGSGDTKIVMNIGTGIKAPALYQQEGSLFEVVQSTPAGAAIEPIGPERSRSFDLGVEQGFANNRARVRVAYFHNTFHDLIEGLGTSSMVRAGVPPAAAVAAGFAYVNSQSYRAQGMEVSFEEAPRPDLRVMASYTYLDAEVTKAFGDEAINPSFPGVKIGQYSAIVGGRPFRRPANAGTFGVIYSPSRFDLALSAYFAGKRDDSTFLSDPFFGNSLLLPNKDLDKAYQKVDLSAGVDVHPRLKIYTSIENLFNQDYEASFGFPALPLTARIGARITLGGDR